MPGKWSRFATNPVTNRQKSRQPSPIKPAHNLIIIGDPMAGCRNVVRRGGSPPRAVCILDVSARLEEAITRRVEIGHPEFRVVVTNV